MSLPGRAKAEPQSMQCEGNPVSPTPAPRVLHWAHTQESTFAAGMWFLYHVHRLLGRLPFRLFLYPVVGYYWATRGTARRASLQYLQRVQAAHNAVAAAPGWHHSLRHFLSFAEAILDKTLALSGRYRFERVRFVGREPVLEMLRAGCGGVFLTGHVGCLELCQATAERQPGLKLNVLVHTRHAERFNRILRRLDPHSSVQLLQVTEVTAATAVTLAEKVARGEFVAMAGDRVPVTASKTARLPFLQHEARFPAGPYVIASLLKCPVYTMFCVREKQGHAVYFGHLADRVELPRTHREVAIAQYAAGFVRHLEAAIAHAPYDWFNFFPFWDQGEPPPLEISPRDENPAG